MKVLEFPTQSLKTPSTDLTQDELTSEVHRDILVDMMRAFDKYDDKAVGIAAPQVGHNRNIILVKTCTLHEVMINPVIIERSESLFKSSEGCLSLPGIKGNVQRNWNITVRYINEQGESRTRLVVGFDAAVVQHEIDHLLGVLFTDHLTGSDKKKADKKLSKRKGK
ncbi:polypeptide deformylase [Vibrio phage 3.058.O._10N.286.46.B8]|nr:polypeptide deformylase [Vibrio phage 2.058.O._10N.286.46.B8]AUS03147.1 polypeptide deformylase [Vibrio phage 3.058.O._10N.286.46.B8]